MVDCSEVFVGMHVLKDRHAVAVAEGGRDGEVRVFGEIGSDGASVHRFVRKLERPGAGSASATRPGRPATDCSGCRTLPLEG